MADLPSPAWCSPQPEFVSHVCFKNVTELQTNGLPKRNFHTQDEKAKEALLGGESFLRQGNDEPVVNAGYILSSLARFSPKVAVAFDEKPKTLSSLVFRLYDERRSGFKSSFIALSYRWQRKNAAQGDDETFPFPMSKTMMSAVLEERYSEDEGFWYDQGCIDQENDEEKSVSIGMMDVIYRESRTVIVALDDILLTSEQIEAIMEYKEFYDKECLSRPTTTMNWGLIQPVPKLTDLANRPVFKKFVECLLRSSRFGRAWCTHEAYLARELIFLVGCEQGRGENTNTRQFLRFTSSFCWNIMGTTNLWRLSNAIPKLSRELIAICSKISTNRMEKVIQTLPEKLSTDLQLPLAISVLPSYASSMLATAVDVFHMAADGDPKLSEELRKLSANRDKLSIALNTVNLGITLKYLPSSEWHAFSEDQCFRILAVFALAAGDPGALCTSGYMIEPENILTDAVVEDRCPESAAHQPTFSFFTRPTTTSGGILTPRLSSAWSLNLGSRSGSDFLKLNLLPLKKDPESDGPHHPRMPLHRPTYRGPIQSEESLSTMKPNAQFFGKLFSGDKGGDQTSSLGTIHAGLEKSTDEYIKQAISFRRQCSELGISTTPSSLFVPPSGCEYADVFESLNIETLATCLRLGVSWIVATSSWSGFSPAARMEDHDMESLFSAPGQKLLVRDDFSKVAAFKILEFVESLIREGMPWHAGNSCTAYWRPITITNPSGTCLTFCPIFEDVIVAVPSCLVNSTYASLSRCWVLQKTAIVDEFHIVGKGRIIAPPSFELSRDGREGSDDGLSCVFGQVKGAWASVLDLVSKCVLLELNRGPLIQECIGLIDRCSKEAIEGQA